MFVAKIFHKALFSAKRSAICQTISNLEELQVIISKDPLPIVLFITYPALRKNTNSFQILDDLHNKNHFNKIPNSSYLSCGLTPGSDLPEPQNNVKSETSLAELETETTKQIELWRFLYFEPDRIAEIQSVFNLKKLPCLFLLKFGQVIDCELNRSRGRCRSRQNQQVLFDFTVNSQKQFRFAKPGRTPGIGHQRTNPSQKPQKWSWNGNIDWVGTGQHAFQVSFQIRVFVVQKSLVFQESQVQRISGNLDSSERNRPRIGRDVICSWNVPQLLSDLGKTLKNN